MESEELLRRRVEAIRQVQALETDIAATEGARLVALFYPVRASHRIFDANSQELGELLVLNASDEFASVLWDVRNRALLDGFLDEATRRLHNYVASAMSLVDHTRKAISKVYPPAGRARAEYDERVRADFAESPEIRFIQDLRVLLLHVDALNVNARFRWDRTEGTKRELMLMRDRLVRWQGWSTPARELIRRSTDDIPIEPPIRRYTATVTAFYNWLADWHRKLHEQAFIELEALQAQVTRVVIEGGLADPDDLTTRLRSLREIKAAIDEAKRLSHASQPPKPSA